MAPQSPLPSYTLQESLTSAKSSSRTSPQQDRPRMSRRLIASMRRVFSTRNAVPVMNELWDVFRNVSTLIPVPGIQVAVGMIDEIKTQVEASSKDMKNSAGIRALESRLRYFKELVEANGYQDETGAKLTQLDSYGPHHETISVFYKRCLETLQISVQELYDERTRDVKIMTIIKSGNYAEKIEEIVTHMSDMFTYIQMQAAIRADVERENEIERRLIQAIPHVEAASDDKVERAPPYEGTYVDIVQRIVDWRDKTTPAIFWLYGLPSSGKTTVLVGAFRKLSQDLTAEFRCTRVIPSYNDVQMIIPTLAWKLQGVNAPYRRQLISRLDRLPEDGRTTDAIRKWSLKQQLMELFIEPFASIPEGQRGKRKVILAIDSLEECFYGAYSAGAANLVEGLLREINEMNDRSQRIKFIIISRDDRGQIRSVLDRPEAAESYSMAEYQSSPVAFKEMMEFYQKELGQLVTFNISDLSSALQELASSTQGYFFLAKANCDMIRKSLDPERKLKDALKNKEFETGVAKYFQNVLDQATTGYDTKDLETFWKALRTITLLQRVMGVEDLALIIDYENAAERLRTGLHRVDSLISTPGRDLLWKKDGGADVIRVQNTEFAEFFGGGKLTLGDNKALETSILECDMAADLLPELKEDEKFDANHPDYQNIYELRGGLRERKINRAIGYACMNWWTHLNKSFEAPPPSQDNMGILVKRQITVIEEIAKLLKKGKRRSWITIIEQDPDGDVKLLAQAINIAWKFLDKNRNMLSEHRWVFGKPTPPDQNQRGVFQYMFSAFTQTSLRLSPSGQPNEIKLDMPDQGFISVQKSLDEALHLAAEAYAEVSNSQYLEDRKLSKAQMKAARLAFN
ncbi:hypothetical protein K435DRAFT_789071 [Dendrothele bispora CBS 962.96]|uniref:Nephrocystin 3-like N-terminal domain-containing protein n=1 Tax=Dendrothele bispora (strain CBS 962.96) TaxID=1314807 RepID=A0A4S8MUN6_DENBC|nr:hypothetical protein K435DRAFT_789071 [Dendrothele bispora CBS 962.96]